MKKSTISLFLSVVMLCLTISGSSCASSQIVLPPPSLERRTLRLSSEVAGFEYTWFECTRKFLGICTEKQQRKELYDLTKKDVREKLIAMGFVARVLENK